MCVVCVRWCVRWENALLADDGVNLLEGLLDARLGLGGDVEGGAFPLHLEHHLRSDQLQHGLSIGPMAETVLW